MRSRAAAAALVVASALGLSGCHLDATVGVRVDERGAGTVTARFVLDADLVKTLHDLGKPVEQQPRVGDLTRAGWKVSPLRTGRDGSATIEATKSFANASSLHGVMTELSGPGGPFRSFSVRRRGRTIVFVGDVVLRGGAADAGVDNTPGVQESELARALQDVSSRYLTVRVAVVLPGNVRDNAPQHVGGQPLWIPKVGERLHLTATATRPRLWRGVVLRVTAIVLAALGLLVIVAPWLRRRRGRSSGPTLLSEPPGRVEP